MKMKTGIYEKYRLFAFLFTSILPCSFAQQSCTATMKNTVVFEGSSTSFTKATADTGTVQWTVAPSSSTFNSINTIDPNSPTTSSSYQVTATQLTILDATSAGKGSNPDSTAGMYLMSTDGGASYCQGAGLTVIISGPNCSYNDTDPKNVQLTCSVEYANYAYQQIRPVMTWTNSSGAALPPDTPQPVSLNLNNPGIQDSISYLPISSTDTSPHGCNVTFSAPSPDQPPNIDPNPPSFWAACVTTPNITRARATTTRATTTRATTTIASQQPTTTAKQLTTTMTKKSIDTNTSPLPSTTKGKSISTALNIAATGATTTIASHQPTTTAKQLTTTMTKKSIVTDTSPPPSTMSRKSIPTASDVFIDPTFGPVAGGTVVTITTTWSYDNISIKAVYIGNNLQANYYDRSGIILLVKTPSINDDQLVNQPLLIILEISNHSSNISTGKYFTYKPNPKIDDVSPRDLPLSGGIRLNITGIGLDSVARPQILAVVRISNGNNITYNNESFDSCEFPTQNGSQMICLSPPFNIREDFLEQLFNGTIQISTNQTYTSTNKHEELKLNVGMHFDGFDRYKDNILRDSNGNFDIYYPPSISCEYNLEFNLQEEGTITIQGLDFTRCCRKQDYVVRIGNEICFVENLTDNELTFNPPKAKPQHTENDTIHCGENFAIFIDLGFKSYECSCLSYDGDTTTKLIIIVVATVGSSLILIIFSIVASVVVRRSRKRKSILLGEPSVYPAPEGNIGMNIGSGQLNNASHASDKNIFRNYQTHIYEDRSTGEEQWNMNEIHGGPSDLLAASSRKTIYPDSYQNEYQNRYDTDYNRFLDEI